MLACLLSYLQNFTVALILGFFLRGDNSQNAYHLGTHKIPHQNSCEILLWFSLSMLGVFWSADVIKPNIQQG